MIVAAQIEEAHHSQQLGPIMKCKDLLQEKLAASYLNAIIDIVIE